MRYSLLKVCRTSYDGTMYPYRIPELLSSGQVAYAVSDEIYVEPVHVCYFPKNNVKLSKVKIFCLLKPAWNIYFAKGSQILSKSAKSWFLNHF